MKSLSHSRLSYSFVWSLLYSRWRSRYEADMGVHVVSLLSRILDILCAVFMDSLLHIGCSIPPLSSSSLNGWKYPPKTLSPERLSLFSSLQVGFYSRFCHACKASVDKCDVEESNCRATSKILTRYPRAESWQAHSSTRDIYEVQLLLPLDY